MLVVMQQDLTFPLRCFPRDHLATGVHHVLHDVNIIDHQHGLK